MFRESDDCDLGRGELTTTPTLGWINAPARGSMRKQQDWDWAPSVLEPHVGARCPTTQQHVDPGGQQASSGHFQKEARKSP